MNISGDLALTWPLGQDWPTCVMCWPGAWAVITAFV